MLSASLSLVGFQKPSLGTTLKSESVSSFEYHRAAKGDDLTHALHFVEVVLIFVLGTTRSGKANRASTIPRARMRKWFRSRW